MFSSARGALALPHVLWGKVVSARARVEYGLQRTFDREPMTDSNPDGPSPAAASPTSEASATSPDDRAPPEPPHQENHSEHGHKGIIALSVAALGVVYGDIGTSPLYALRECFSGAHGLPVTETNIFGVLSLIFWSLTLSVSIKYVLYVLRADNHGEGGELALMALALTHGSDAKWRKKIIILLGLFGAALLYGDGMLTPAVSVLSAVEGLTVVTSRFEHVVLPITCILLCGLFLAQKRGTGKIGAIFGPVMVLWFCTIALLGLGQLLQEPRILASLNPVYAVQFFVKNGLHGMVVLGAVFLVITGGEALYADMGHFGPQPIRVSWFFFVGPALLLNYLGQGALLLQSPELAESPFFSLAPRWALLPLVILSTCATIIASQALISGAFSVTRQATMLGYLPRFEVRHTSAHEIGQIYVPLVNWVLMISTILLVLSFQSSTRLAAAYGVAVTTSMLITTALAYVVARKAWKWSAPLALSVTIIFFCVDLAFFSSTVLKIPQGGWVPLLVGAAMLTVMLTWHRGRGLVAERIVEEIIPIDDFVEVLHVEMPARVPGTAVFMTSNSDGTPPPLMQNFRFNRVVHKQVILLTVVTEQVPYVDVSKRVDVTDLGHGFIRIVAHYGFMEQPDLTEILRRPDTPSPPLDHTTFFLGREALRLTERGGMARWRKFLYAFLLRNSAKATTFFGLPSDRVIEIGGQIDL